MGSRWKSSQRGERLDERRKGKSGKRTKEKSEGTK